MPTSAPKHKPKPNSSKTKPNSSKSKSAAHSSSLRSESHAARGSSLRSEANALKVVDRPTDFKGIEGLMWVDARTLTDNPANWKVHPERQSKSLDSEIATVGWAAALCYNMTTGRLIDGHLRKSLDAVKKQPIVPVLYGHWSPAEEKQLLLHLDPSGAMYEIDQARYRQLMDEHQAELEKTSHQLNTIHRESLDALNKTLDFHNESLSYGAPKSFLPDISMYAPEDNPQLSPGKEVTDIDAVPPVLPGAYDLKLWQETPFNAFDPTGPYGIPHFRLDRMGDIPDGQVQTWVGPETPDADWYFYIYGSAAIEKVRTPNMVCAWYTYDEKFESIWNDPRKFTARMLNVGIKSVVCINFSIWEFSPPAFSLWQTYRSRWLARYWQEAGLQVIPDLLIGSGDESSDYYRLRFETIPKNLPCVACQLQQKGKAKKEAYYAVAQHNLTRLLHQLTPQKILLYHAQDLPPDFTRDFPQETQAIHVPTFMEERLKILKQKDYLK